MYAQPALPVLLFVRKDRLHVFCFVLFLFFCRLLEQRSKRCPFPLRGALPISLVAKTSPFSSRRMGDFCVLMELIFAIGKNWVFLLGINFCDFQEVAFIGIIAF